MPVELIQRLKQQLNGAFEKIQKLEIRLRSDPSLDDLQNLFKVTVEQMHEGIQIIDRNWRYMYLNSAATLHSQRQRNDLIGHTMMEMYPGIDKTDIFPILESVMNGGEPRSLENHFIYPDGSKCWFELFVEPHPSGLLIRSMDITKRKQVEEQFQHAQKIDAIGLLAGGIAHDFNNKLGIMTLFCEMAISQLNDQAKAKGYVETVLIAVKESSALTRQLLAFGRKQVFDLKVISLNDIVNNVRVSLEKLLGENIFIHCHLNPQISNVKIDPAQLDQVILNLCINARDAMPKGGNLIFETSEIELDQDYCRSRPDVQPGKYVMLSISDDGIGMTREVRERIFEPFFTTKSKEQGTGLGLATVHGVVKQSRGHIWVYSEPGMGTTFKIFFPSVSNAEKDALHASPESEKVENGHETLLLIEDDTLLREGIKEMLEGAGYTVLSASNLEEAESLFSWQYQQISLMLTDVVLPKVSGPELAAKFRGQNPALKVIYISGYTENYIVHHGVLDINSILLQKPIATNKLLRVVRQVLDGKLDKGVF